MPNHTYKDNKQQRYRVSAVNAPVTDSQAENANAVLTVTD